MKSMSVSSASTLVQEHVAQFLRHLRNREHQWPRRIGLAISGGVDSMALATLCKGSRSGHVFTGFIVDHGVRQNSSDEAAKVAFELRRTGIEPMILRLDWNAYGNPKDLTNFEAVARRLRYQAIGKACYEAGIRSLLVGHHADDQAETVLTRIVSGYLGAGLAGIQAEALIPECAGLYGVDGSGSMPSYLTRPDEDSSKGMLIEHGGVSVCRPLLPFTKDQLIQVCRNEKVKWFEDPTNTDQKLTVRNTIRHLHGQAVLPVALQRDTLCALALTAKTRSAYINTEVDRLFDAMDIELNLRLGQVIFTVDRDVVEKCGDSAASLHRIKSALLRKLMQLVTSRSVLLQGFESAVERVFSSHSYSQAVQVGKVNVQPAKHNARAKGEDNTFVLSRQKPNKSDALVASELNLSTDPTKEWSLWDHRYWVRLQYKYPPLHPASLHMSVRFLTPTMLGDLRKTLDYRQRLALQKQLEHAKEQGVLWTLPVFVTRKDGQESVVSLPSLRWENPAVGNFPFHLDIRYKSVDFENSKKHRIIS